MYLGVNTCSRIASRRDYYRRGNIYDNSCPDSSFAGYTGGNSSGDRTHNQDPPPVSNFTDPEKSLMSRNLNTGQTQQGDEFRDVQLPPPPSLRQD